MKKTFKYIMLAAAAIASAACTEELNNNEPVLGEEITIEAGVLNGADTKVNFTDDEANNKVIVNWNESGEAFTAFIGGTPSVFSQVSAPENGKAKFAGVLPDGVGYETVLYAVYPEVEAASASAVAVDLSSQNGKERDENNTYMYGSSALAQILTSGLTFHHLGSVLKVTLAFADAQGAALAEGTAKNVTFTASDLASKATVDFTQAVPAVTASEQGSIVLGGEFALDAEGKAVVYLHVLPATLADLKVTAVVGEKTYTAEIGGRADGKAMEAGKQYAVSATCAEAAPETFTDYYVTVGGTGSGASWADPTTLTNALAAAPKDATIHVAAGTYYPEKSLAYVTEGVDENKAKGFEIIKPVTIIGGYPSNPAEGAVSTPETNATVLDGNGTSYHVMSIAVNKSEGKVVFKGLTITGGKSANETADIKYEMERADGTPWGVTINAKQGGGIIAFGSIIEMENVKIDNNNGFNAGGFFALNSDIKILNSSISDNTSTDNRAGAFFQINGGFEGSVYMENCHIDRNKSANNKNQGGVYALSNGGLFKEFSAINTTFNENLGKNGPAAYISDAIKTQFISCEFIDNLGHASVLDNGQAGLYIQSDKHSAIDVLIKDCVFKGNKYMSNGSGAYVTNTGNGKGVNLAILNSSFIENDTKQRGTIWLRNQSTAKFEAVVANSSFVNNVSSASSGGGSAISVNGAATKPITLDVIGCTITGNDVTSTSKHGALFIEDTGVTLNVYNTIISGNTSNGAVDDVHELKTPAVLVYHSSIIGDKYYNAEGVETVVTPAFDYATMFADLVQTANTWGCKLVGDASTNPAFGNGSTLVELEALADEVVTADLLKKDQAGNDRTDTDRIIGALVK